MEQIIYADILFAVDFSMDFLALYVTAFILKKKFRTRRAVIAAALGAVYGIISLSIATSTLCGAVLTIAVGIVMCSLISGFSGVKAILRESVVFLSVNLILGGGMTVVYEYFNSHGGADSILIYGNPETVQEQLPMAIFIAAGIAVALLMVCFGRGLVSHGGGGSVALEISHKGKRLNVNALEDSGNLLTEPISGRPVVILRKALAKELLSPATLDALTKMTVEKNNAVNERIRFVLYESVSGSGMLGAFMPESLSVNGVEVSGWIAVSDNMSLKKGGIGDAIVPSALVG